MNFIALLLTLLVGMFILLGCLFSINFKNNKKFTDFSISIAFGVIIGLVILELIPEAFEILESSLGIFRSILAVIVLALIGIVILKILDIFVPHHEHEAHHHHKHKEEICHNEHLYHIGVVSAIAVIIHNVIEGMSLYVVASSNIVSGLLLCIGIGLHNIPMGLIITSTLSSTNFTKEKIFKINLLVSLSTFIGGIFMFIVGGVDETIEGILLSVTLGMLIYISIFELLHQIYHMKNKKIATTGISIGVILLVVSVIIEHILHA